MTKAFSTWLGILCLWLAGCGPTLQHTAVGWKQEGTVYAIAPRPDGSLMSPAWTLANYTPAGAGYRRESRDAKDFEIKRTRDDGVLVIVTEKLDDEAASKRVEVLVDRWFVAVVSNPNGDPNVVWSVDEYEDLLPPERDVATVQVGLRSGTIREVGRNVEITRRATFSVPQGEGNEVEAKLVPRGAPGPDRMLYVAALRPASASDRLVVVAYANTPTMFEEGVAEASDLAHRIRF